MAGFADDSSGFDVVYADNVDFSGGSTQNAQITLNGQLLIGSTALPHIKVGNLTSAGGTVTITNGSGTINLEAGTSIPTTFIANNGSASPIANILNIIGSIVAAGTNPLRTIAGGNTVNVQTQFSQAIVTTDATKVGLANFDSAAFDVDANGFVQLNGGGIATTAFSIQANTAPGTNPVVPTAAGVVTVNGAAVANHSVVLETRSRAANAYNLEVQYATSAAATDATKSGVSHFNSAQFTVDANGFVSTSGSGVPNTITGDSGGALSPSSGNWNIFGLSGSKTSGSGSTLTIKSPPYADQGGSTTVTLNSGSFATAAITLTLPASAGLADGDLFEFVAVTAGALVIQAVGAQKIRLGNQLSSAAGSLTSTAIGDSISLRFRATDGFFYVTSSIGNWTIA